MSSRKNLNNDDIFDLRRFVVAQDNVYQNVLRELQNGKKRSHWMWFIFPQLEGLGRSSTARFYSIKSLEEAQAYLNHPILGNRLLECTNTILSIEGKSALQIFGIPDDLKLKSSMTLFAFISPPNSIFHQALTRFCGGKKDDKTISLLENLPTKN